jgi:hypothetical protein
MKRRKLLFIVLVLIAVTVNAETPVLPILSSNYVLSSGDEAWYYIRFDNQNGLGYYLYAQYTGEDADMTIQKKSTGSKIQLWKLSKKNASGDLANNNFLVISKQNASVYSNKTMKTKSLSASNTLQNSRVFYLYQHQAAAYSSSWVVRDGANSITGGWNANTGVKVGTSIAWWDNTFKDPGDAISFHLYEYDRAVSSDTGTKYGTICLPVATTVSTDNNTKLFSISGFFNGDNTKLYLSEETVTDSKYTLTAGKPYIFSTTSTDKVTFTVATDEDATLTATISSNGLEGTLPSSTLQTNTITQTSGSNYYVLHNNAWYKVGSVDGTTTTTFNSGAARAYLNLSDVPTISSAKSAISIDIDEDNTTGIESTTTPSSKSTNVYNLQGVKVSSDVSVMSKGIYIINGKKIIK